MRGGFVLYEGPSKLDGVTPIVVVATFRTRNAKTGRMLQTWIMRQDENPLTSVTNGTDAPMCGRCPWRAGNGCYVNAAQAPLSVWRKYRRGGYPRADLRQLAAIGAGLKVRLGSYGDPLAAPVKIWRALVSRASGHSGYTHQWQWRRGALAFRRLVMASVDSPAERQTAMALGWRTFRVKMTGAPRERGEVVCPASVERGKKANCASCLACNGADNGRALDIVIDAHGPGARAISLVQIQL